MAGEDRPKGAVWRGSDTGASTSIDPFDRILLIIGSDGNRKRLSDYLSRHYQVMLPKGDALPAEPFDLAVVDLAGAARWRQRLTKIKAQEQPTFLPVLLVVPRHHLTRQLRGYWDFIDEFLVSPIDPSELSQRVQMLLRARRLALTQRSYLTYLVTHDRATGLPNKTLFVDRLSQAIQDATVLDQRVYVAVIHVPLSPILKSLGAQGFEQAAVVYSTALRAVVPEEASLARLTNEEWGLRLHASTSVEDILYLCRQIQTLASKPLRVDGENVHVAPRVGVAIYPDDAPNASALLDCAIAALAEPAQTSTAPAFYSRRVQQQALRHIRMEARLHEAIQASQFELWLQPKLRLRDRRMTGAEALVRWRLSSGELVPPSGFIKTAESVGLITQIDRWMLESVCVAMRAWRTANRALLPVSVNLSAQHLNAPDLVAAVTDTLQRHDIPPFAIELELTETALAEMNRENLDKLVELRNYGLGIALDDFGTGYCSLSYLHRLPITTLKIDKSFVDDITENETNSLIAQAIVWLANNCGLSVVAEGIETEAQAARIAALGVPVGQGFLFGRPMPEPQLRESLPARLAP